MKIMGGIQTGLGVYQQADMAFNPNSAFNPNRYGGGGGGGGGGNTSSGFGVRPLTAGMNFFN